MADSRVELLLTLHCACWNPTARAWTDDLGFLHACHLELRRAAAAQNPGDLERQPGRWTLAEHAFSAANHDTYHAEQIRLRRMNEDA